MVRILVVSPSQFPGTTGDSSNYVETVIGLAKRGAGITFVCPTADGMKPFDKEMSKIGVNVLRIPMRRPQREGIVRTNWAALLVELLVFYVTETWLIAIAALKRPTYCLVRHNLFSIPAGPTLKLLGCRNLADGHPISPGIRQFGILPEFFVRWFGRVEGALLRCYTHYKVTSVVQADSIRSLGFPGQKIIKTINAIKTEAVPKHPVSESERGTFCYFGELKDDEGLDFLIKALARATAMEAKIRLYLMGGGPYKGELVRLIRSLNLESNVVILDAVPRVKLLQEYFKLFRTTVIPRPTQAASALGMSVIESLAAGKPIVVTDDAAVRESVKQGVIFVTYGDVDQLANRLVQLSRNDDLVEKLSAEAIAESRKFDIDAYLDSLLRVLGLA